MANETSKIRDFHRHVLELNGGAWFPFEQHLSALYHAVLRPGAIAIDGGANTGVHTLQMGQAVRPGGLVIAIEPVPELLARLDTRWREYRMPEDLIRRLPYGLSNAAGEADFYQVIDPIQHELSGLRNRHFLKDRPVQTIRVELTTLDLVCKDLDRLDFLKLDLEGAEMDALRGGMRTLTRLRPVVTLEQDQYSPQYFSYTWDQLLEYFAALDYELYDLFGQRYTEPSLFEQCAVWDFVGLPAGYQAKDALFNAVRRSMDLAGVKLPSGNGAAAPPAPGASNNLKLRGLTASCSLDYIGAVSNPQAEEAVCVLANRTIRFSGWAIDEPDQTVAGGVDLVIDGIPYAAIYGWQRVDVANCFKNMACQASGYVLDLAPGTLCEGEHVVAVRVISHDRTSYYQGPTVRFRVTG